VSCTRSWNTVSNVPQVRTIIGKYNRALENIVESRNAFLGLDNAAPPMSKAVWEESIAEAERQREFDPTSMDIMQSKIKTGATVKEIMADIMRKDGLSMSIVPDGGNATEWLLEGFMIEDEQ